MAKIDTFPGRLLVLCAVGCRETKSQANLRLHISFTSRARYSPLYHLEGSIYFVGDKSILIGLLIDQTVISISVNSFLLSSSLLRREPSSRPLPSHEIHNVVPEPWNVKTGYLPILLRLLTRSHWTHSLKLTAADPQESCRSCLTNSQSYSGQGRSRSPACTW